MKGIQWVKYVYIVLIVLVFLKYYDFSWLILDDEKPTVSTFLHSLILEMNTLYEKGNDIVFIINLYTLANNINLTIKSPNGDIPY